MKKQLLRMVLMLSMVISVLVPLSANAASSGTCGDSVNWTLADNGTLTISGTGQMSNYIESTLPWKDLRDSIKNVVIGEGVTSVGGTAFYNCTNLVSVSIPATVTEIEPSAFSGCTALASVDLPDALTAIEGNAFYNCQSLTSITIPENVTSIGPWAFHSCLNVSSITWNAINVADFLSSYGTFANAGSNTSGITVVFGNNVESIPSYAFRSCPKVTTVTVPDSVTYIGEYAFDGTTYYNNAWQNNGLYIGSRLVKVKDPSYTLTGKFEVKSGTKYICAKAFEGIKKWTNIIVPDSVIRIDEGAFYDCTALKSITLPFIGTSRTAKDSYDSVLGYIFGSADENTDGTIVQNHKGGSGNYYIPSTLISVTITDADTIGYGAFSGCSTLTSITIPSAVTEIGPIAFANCTALPSFTIPTGVQTIENSTFSGCSALTSITIPSNVTTVGDWAFSDCDKLATVSIANTVTSIGDWAFSGCDVLNNLTWPEGATRIGGYTFYNCSGLTSLTVPETVTSIGENAFYGTAYYNDSTKWENGVLYLGDFLIKANKTISGEYQIKGGTKYIADDAFLNCNLISNIIIPESVAGIGEQAFYNCDGLIEVTIPDSVTEIGDWAFFGCDYMDKIDLGIGVSTIGRYAFANCPALTGVVLPDGITAIGESAFSYCDGLTSITIPDSMTDMAYRLFYDCDGLTSATIGRNVASIGGYAFGDNDNLKTVVIPKSVTEIMAGAFERCESIRTVIYDGDGSEWEQIDIDILNECIFNINASISLDIEDGVFYVTPFNLRSNNVIVFACYSGEKLVFAQTHLYQDSDPERIPFAPNVDYDKVKVMLWDSLGGMSPMSEAKTNVSAGSVSIDFTSTPNAVTNIDTSKLITVSFADPIDMDTVTTTTVYAVAQESKEGGSTYSVTEGDVYTIPAVKKDSTNNSFGIDISNLASGVKYKIVIDGVMETSGKYISYTSDEFTTGAIANIEYADDVMIKNIAKDATIAPGVETSTANELGKWIDGDSSTSFNFNSETFADNYAVIDLGELKNVNSIGIELTGVAWHSAGVGVFVKETLDGVSYDTLTADNGCIRLSGTENSSPVYAGMMEYIAVDTSKKYRYVIIKDMSTDSNYDLALRDVYILSGESSITADVDLTSTPDAVTNVDTTEMITVNFSSDVDMESVDADSVYAVALEDKNSVALGTVYPLGGIIKDGVDNSFMVDIGTLPSHTKFELVVDGISTKSGNTLAAVSEEFTTGVIARLPYVEGKIIKNVAAEATISSGVEVSGLNDNLAKWLDDNTADTFNFNSSTYPNNYAIVDFGETKEISAVGIQLTGTPWHSSGTGIYLKDSLTDVSYTTLTTSDAKKLSVATADNSPVYDNMVDHITLDEPVSAQYLILKDISPASGNRDFQIRKVFAFVREDI